MASVKLTSDGMKDSVVAGGGLYGGSEAATATASGAKQRRRPSSSNEGSAGVYNGSQKGAEPPTYPNKYRKSGPSWLKALLYRISSATQRWLLQHPNFLTKLLLWLIYLLEAVEAAIEESKKPGEGGPFVCWQRAKVLGPSFCVFGQVLTGDISKVKDFILEPQTRAATIAWIRMVRDRFPHEFLLFMTDEEAGGDGLRERIKKLYVNEIFGTQALKDRASDSFTKKLLAEFSSNAAKETRKYDDASLKAERETFALRYINYIILGLKLSDEDVALAAKFRAGYVGGRVFPIGFLRGKGLSDDEQKLVNIWSAAPALQGIDYSKYGLTKDQIVRSLQPAFGVAAMPAANNFVNYILNFTPKNAKLDFTDKETFGRDFTLEMLRFHTPVATVNVIKSEAFEIKMGGKIRKFPKGTTVGLNMWLSMHDSSTFHDPFKFDYTRAGLTQNSTSFHSVGDQTYGRSCPARKLMENFAGDFIESLKKAGWKPDNSPEWLV